MIQENKHTNHVPKQWGFEAEDQKYVPVRTSPVEKKKLIIDVGMRPTSPDESKQEEDQSEQRRAVVSASALSDQAFLSLAATTY